MPIDTDLHKAANNGDLIKCQEILEAGEIDVNTPGAAGRRPLHRAAGANHVNIMQYLIEKGALVRQTDKSGRTALHWASISGHRDAVELLLASDSPIMAVTTSGSTAMSAAAEAGRDEIVRILMEKAQSDVKLEEICSIKDSSGKSPFDLASDFKHKAVYRTLKGVI